MERSVTGGVLGGSGQEFRETISEVLLKSLLLQNCLCHVIIFCHVDRVKCVMMQRVLTKHFCS